MCYLYATLLREGLTEQSLPGSSHHVCCNSLRLLVMWSVVCSLEFLRTVFPWSAHVATPKRKGTSRALSCALEMQKALDPLGPGGSS